MQLQGTTGGSAAMMDAAGGEPMAPERRVHFQEATNAAGSTWCTGAHFICVLMGSRYASNTPPHHCFMSVAWAMLGILTCHTGT